MLIGDQQFSWAIEIFKTSIELFTNNSNTWNSLSDAYLAEYQKYLVKLSFVKAI